MGECGGEGVARADRVGDFDGKAGVVIPFIAGDKEAAVAAAGDGYELQRGELDEQALRTQTQRLDGMIVGLRWFSAGQAEKPHDEGDLGVVHLHDRGQFERLLNDLAGVEGSAQVYVKDTNAL